MTDQPPTLVQPESAAIPAFDLGAHPAKSAPALIAADERHLARVATTLRAQIARLARRLDHHRKSPARDGQEILERDLETHRLTGQLRTLRRFGLDLCLGRMVREGEDEAVYIGRLGLADEAGDPLLIDWRAPAAEPFFGATLADPMGLVSRRRYRWTNGQVTDYWDEAFTAAGLDAIETTATLDTESAFIAGLGGGRTERMRDVLATIQADQDAIIRAGSRQPLVVDGGPGTGKTVVALHRAAYLLYADPRLSGGRGGVLFVGPHQPYLTYISDILPNLGEDGVATCTLRDLVAEGAAAAAEPDPEAARLKADRRMAEAIEPAIGLYEEPPTETLVVETDWGEVALSAADWAEAFAAPEPGSPHNDARDTVWDALVEIVHDRLSLDEDDPDAPPLDRLGHALRREEGFRAAVDRAWPVIDPADLVGDLWSVPAYLRRCAPWLTPEQVRALQREDPQAWTIADLPLLDAARQRVGDPEGPARRRRREAALAAQREEMDRVVTHLIESDDSEMHLMSMLRGSDLRGALVDESATPSLEPDALAGPFAHVVVDEAQELTDAEWQMVLRRCPSRSVTVVGDRAQARHGFTETWPERLARVGSPRSACRASASTTARRRRSWRPPSRSSGPRSPTPACRYRCARTVFRSDTAPWPSSSPSSRNGRPPIPRDWGASSGRPARRHTTASPSARGSGADAGAGQGHGVRHRRPPRARAVRPRCRGGGGPLRRNDPGDRAARRPHRARVRGAADAADVCRRVRARSRPRHTARGRPR